MRCLHPITLRKKLRVGVHNTRGALVLREKNIVVPCGKCLHCMINNRTAWTFRLRQEAKTSVSCWFLTLTYSDDYNDGNVWKPHIQSFLKRLRKFRKLRYYCVAEYSPQVYRPHYHLTIFLDHEVSFNQLYKDIYQSWTMGQISLFSANYATLHYCTKHHILKLDFPPGCMPTFTLMSTKPAIGSGYLTSKAEYHKGNLNRAYAMQDGVKLALPRYYKDKLYNKVQRRLIARQYDQTDYVNKDNWFKHNKGKDEHQYYKYVHEYIIDSERKLQNLKLKKR